MLADQIQAIGNTKEAAQVLHHLETMTIDSVVILKDLHRQMDDPVVVQPARCRRVIQLARLRSAQAVASHFENYIWSDPACEVADL